MCFNITDSHCLIDSGFKVNLPNSSMQFFILLRNKYLISDSLNTANNHLKNSPFLFKYFLISLVTKIFKTLCTLRLILQVVFFLLLYTEGFRTLTSSLEITKARIANLAHRCTQFLSAASTLSLNR